MRLIPLASSSTANSTAIVAGGHVVIVDAGIRRKQILGMLSDLGVLNAEYPRPAALLLTHNHSDHARYAYEWLRANAPIHCTLGTALAIGIDLTPDQCWHRTAPMVPERVFGSLTFTSIRVSHDAADPVAWRVAADGAAAVIATDLGKFPPGFDLFCRGATDLLLETNYHRLLLATCNYTPDLKKRIASDSGHMDLEMACEWLRDCLPASVKRVYLGHLSKEACHPTIVRHYGTQALAGKDVELIVLGGLDGV